MLSQIRFVLLTTDILCGTMYLKEAQYMNIDDWRSQIKRGTLEFCILLMIRRQPSYGYEIISTLERCTRFWRPRRTPSTCCCGGC